MKKYIQIMSFILFITLNLWGKEISEEVAIIAAKNFYSQKTNQNKLNISETHHILHQNELMIYAFNFESNGFVLVSADDRVLPIIGYSTESGFSSENIPQQLHGLIEEYKREIIFAVSQDSLQTNQIANEWITVLDPNFDLPETRSVNPLIHARFNQPNPWNLLCPDDPNGPGGHALVGCVAVSMVQVMHYWSYPEVGFGSHGYNHNQYGYLFADFGDAFYDYDNMSNHIATSSSQLLLYHAGVAIDMGYGPSGSGAWVGTNYPCAMSAMEEHFLYKDIIHFEEKNDYSNSNWRNLLKDELDSGRPMIYRGYDNSGGHAWNIDGYDGDYFHCNWGWGGSYNGYFLLSNLSAGGYTFGQGQAAVMGIEPQSLTEPNILLTDYYFNETLGDGDGVVNPGEEINIFVTVQNLIPWPTATNVFLILSTDETAITIIDNSAYVQTIDSDASFTNESSPFSAIVSDDANLKDYQFQLNVSADSDEDDAYNNSFLFDVKVSLNQANFPIAVDNQLAATPTIIDYMGDENDKEILLAEYWGDIHFVDKNGVQLSEWQYDMGNQVWGTPAIGDINGDGENEIVLTSKNGKAVILDSNGNEILEYDADQFLMGTPALGNLDEDESLEIIFGGYSPSGKLFAINADGSEVEGFPVNLSERILSGVALADLNSNERDDIVCATLDGNVYLIYDNGTIASGFPLEIGATIKIAPSIIISEMDTPLILLGSKDDNFYGINSDGSIRFIIPTGGDVLTSPAIATNLNGEIQIAFGSNDDYLYLLDKQGDIISGWPQNLGANVSVSPVFADLNDDGNPEVISAAGNTLYAFHLDGSLVEYFPMSFSFPFTSSFMVDDLDLDGDIEIAVGSSNDLVIVDIKSGQMIENLWSMYRGNLHRNGTYYSNTNQSNITVQNSEGWNLIGIPLSVEDHHYLTVFPTAIENTLFEFGDNSYISTFELFEGKGYWLRFSETGETPISGNHISSLEIDLAEGWNLISGLSESIMVIDIVDNNQIIVPNTVYYYEDGYFSANQLNPGMGYWLKTFDSGSITLNGNGRSFKSSNIVKEIEGLNTIDINGVRLYFGEIKTKIDLNQFDLPPKPPIGGFDVRFKGDTRVTKEKAEIEVMSTTEIITIAYNVVIDAGEYMNWVLISETGDEFILEDTGELTVPSTERFVLNRKPVVPINFALHQNFPNPFNPITTLRYDLPSDALVTLSIYDMLGREITQLVNTNQQAGFKSVQWDATDMHGKPVSAGVYLYQIQAGEYVQTRKMVLLK
jgi:hypothetical protein